MCLVMMSPGVPQAQVGACGSWLRGASEPARHLGAAQPSMFIHVLKLLLPLSLPRREAFDLFDTDGSGTIDAKELKGGLLVAFLFSGKDQVLWGLRLQQVPCF